MNHPNQTESLPLSGFQRGSLVGVGGIFLILLGTATVLEPSPRGLGTHQQLGLPPCSFRLLLGVRCPACGMTTAWSHLVRAQLGSALRANVGGTLLACGAAVLGPWFVLSGIRGRWLGRPPVNWIVLAAGLCVVVVTLLEWIGRLLASSGN